MNPNLPPLPDYMRGLPVDDDGVPVPFVVAWIDGKADRSQPNTAAMTRCIQEDLCAICGEKLGRFKAFTLSHQQVLTGVASDPPGHLECVFYAAEVLMSSAPIVVVVWSTEQSRLLLSGRRPLWEVGAPDRVGWFVGGRPAVREEIEADSGAALEAIRSQLDGSNREAWQQLDDAHDALLALLDQLPTEVH